MSDHNGKNGSTPQPGSDAGPDNAGGHGDGHGEGYGDDENNNENQNENVIEIPTLADRDRMRREKQAREDAWRQQYRQKQGFGLAPGGGSEPMINMPPATKWLLLSFIGIHLLITFLLDPVARFETFMIFGFVPGYYTGYIDAAGWMAVPGAFTYMFLHGNWMHLIMNGVMLMAFGTGLERWIGARRLLVFFYLCALLSVFVHFLLNTDSTSPVIGASGGLSGLFGGVLVMLHQSGMMGRSRYGIWPFVVLWIVISLLFGTMGNTPGAGGHPVAWAAHIGGFLAGLALINPVRKHF